MAEVTETESFEASKPVAEAIKAVIDKRAETREMKYAAEKAVSGLSSDQKDHLAVYLLEGWGGKDRQKKVLEMVLETWLGDLTDEDLKLSGQARKKIDYRRRLEWVRGYFGTKFERQGQPRFREAKLSTVIGALVRFCLSAGDRPKGQPADLGLFTLTADPKTGEALLALSQEDESVAITEAGYNQAQELLRMVQAEFGDKMLGGRKLTELVAEVREGLTQVGKGGPVAPDLKGVRTFREEEAYKKRRTAYEERKAMEEKMK
jgi:hypothetical protein